MALTLEEAALLESLQRAYDALIAGDKVASSTYKDSTTTYTRADLDRLERRIAGLQAKAADTPTGRGRIRHIVPYA